MPTDIGFIGLGVMGTPMARNLLAHEGNLAVYDVRSEAVQSLVEHGALACASPAEVADRAEVVFVSLPSPDALTEVVTGTGGLLQGRRLRAVVDFSTTGPVVARQVAARLAEAGVGFVDSPVSGGPRGAETGTLTMMVSGEPELLAELEPLIAAVGSNVLQAGDEPGLGQLAKVINNLMAMAPIVIAAEGLALGMRGGLQLERLLEIVNSSSGRNAATQGAFPNYVMTRNFDFGFRLRLAAKDVALCLEEANHQKVPMLVGNALGQLWSIADAQASDQDDYTAVATLIEKWAGVTFQKGA
jgi:3-hydroxyisobutyrate dehydrogenase-like beta-hydroxyacid dehydrogenase